MYLQGCLETAPSSGHAREVKFSLPREMEEVMVMVRDRGTFETFQARAIVSRSPERLPGADRLWVRNVGGTKSLAFDEPWAIKILEVLEEEGEAVHLSTATQTRRRRGSFLETLIKRREQAEGEAETRGDP